MSSIQPQKMMLRGKEWEVGVDGRLPTEFKMIRTPSKVTMVSSSPGKAEKLPALMLTTLLRGKGGSRSRGRSSASISRSSPMFTARRSFSVDIQEEKEPSSPKVTCISQVRISKRKSSASSSSSSSLRSKQEQQQKQKQGRCVPGGCRCFQRGFFFHPFSKGFGVKFKPGYQIPYCWEFYDKTFACGGCYGKSNRPL